MLDRVLACSFGIGWMIRDARPRKITTWPFIVMTFVVGSIGLLAYMVWRGFAPPREIRVDRQVFEQVTPLTPRNPRADAR